jgi:signal transduction histidine kinase
VVGEIAATLAHEIGSPLQVLNGRSRDLAARTDLPPNAAKSAGILVEQTERIHQIVEQLLDLARRKAPKIAEFDVREPVRRVVELFSTPARRSGVRLEIETQDVPRLEGDQAQVQQVVLNLLQNAIRASNEGGVVRVSVTSASFERPSDSSPQASVAITVDDSGRGIPDAIESRIFEPFFTAWNGEGEAQGTGLGLAVVKSIVTDHGGLVTVTKPPSGAGARFVVHFPVHRAANRMESP